MADTQPTAPASTAPSAPLPSAAPAAPPPAPAPKSEPKPEVKPAAPAGSVTYAGFGDRLVARLLDALILSLIGGVLAAVVIISVITVVGMVGKANATTSANFTPLVMAIAYILAFVMLFIYLYLIAKNGQGPGKAMMKLKIVKKGTSDAPGWGGAILREIVGSFANGLVFFLGYLWMLWDTDKQTWADKIANTVVIKV